MQCLLKCHSVSTKGPICLKIFSFFHTQLIALERLYFVQYNLLLALFQFAINQFSILVCCIFLFNSSECVSQWALSFGSSLVLLVAHFRFIIFSCDHFSSRFLTITKRALCTALIGHLSCSRLAESLNGAAKMVICEYFYMLKSELPHLATFVILVHQKRQSKASSSYFCYSIENFKDWMQTSALESK